MSDGCIVPLHSTAAAVLVRLPLVLWLAFLYSSHTATQSAVQNVHIHLVRPYFSPPLPPPRLFLRRGWVCLGVVVVRYFGCTSYPLCIAKRPTQRNGAVVELIAEEQHLAGGGDVQAAGDASAAACSGRSSVGGRAHAGLGVSDGIGEPDPTGITRWVWCWGVCSVNIHLWCHDRVAVSSSAG